MRSIRMAGARSRAWAGCPIRGARCGCGWSSTAPSTSGGGGRCGRRRRGLVRVLGETLGRRSAPAVRRLLASPRTESRDGALEVLELAGAATDIDRLAVARTDLADPRTDCAARTRIARRLALVSDSAAAQMLESWQGACGATEARDALRRRARGPLASAH